MLELLKKLWRKLWHKKLKAKHVVPTELTAEGYMKAPDYMCVGYHGFDQKDKEDDSKKR